MLLDNAALVMIFWPCELLSVFGFDDNDDDVDAVDDDDEDAAAAAAAADAEDDDDDGGINAVFDRIELS